MSHVAGPGPRNEEGSHLVLRPDARPIQSTEPTDPAGALPGFPRSARYAFVAMIGQGGMGVIYRAIDRTLDHEIALKVLRAGGPDAVARLKAEFRARADLHHPNLLQLLDLVVTPDAAFFTMELVDAVDLLAWVWQAGERDVARRLAAALASVASALDALHAGGFVHFDVKPSNILVDRTGRALLADFGLSTAIRSRAGEPALDVDGAGTPDYMAPERHRGGVVTPASDLYSLGAVILEALTGSPRGDDARTADPLLVLARRLMAREPEERPSAREAAAALAALTSVPAVAFEPSEPPFVGRAQQLDALAAAFARADDSTTVELHVHGPSGIGKTALIRRFLDRVVAARPDAIVLRGRCHPHEQIAFGGLDRVIDGLAAYVRDGTISLAGLSPRGLTALVRLFPAIPWRVPGAPGRAFDDDRGLRLLGISTLRELLARTAAARPLVMWFDDLQWLDDDTEEVLAAIARIPNATLVCSYRLDDAARLTALRAEPEPAGEPRPVRVELELGELATAELEVLVRAAAPEATAPACRELAIAARGNPVFARVLGRRGLHRAGERLTGDDGSPAALWNALLDALPAAQRALFDAIAIAPGPVAAAIVTRAVEVDHASAELRALEQLGVVSRAPGRGAMRFAPFHDQLRQLRLGHLDAATRARLHRALARSHEEAETADYEALVHHLHAIPDDRRAGHYAVLAGQRAAAGLAFGAAASYYARAIEWLPDRPEPWELHERLAECEANRGHAEDAGRHFERAAASRAAGVGAGPATTRLAMRAAEQLLRCGQIPDGYRLMRDVLATLRVRLPASHRAALVHSAVLRVRLVLRGLAAAPRAELAVDDELRMDALWMASTSLAHVNYALADVLLLHHMRHALDAGNPSRIARSLTYEAAAEITLGVGYFDRRAEAMMARAEQLLAEGGDDYDHGWFQASCAAIGFFRARWPDTIAHAEVAERYLLRHGIGVAWERAVLSSYWLFALALTGDATGLEARRRIALDDALARRDRLAESQCRSGYTTLAWLFRDDVAAARRDRATRLAPIHREHASPGRWPEASFGTPDYHALLADCHIELYAGDARAAHARVEAAWPLVERALLLRIQFVGVDLRFLRARCALAAGRGAAIPRRLVALAARERARIARDPSPVAQPYRALLGGLLGHAPDLLDDAARGFDDLAMAGHAAAARFRRGELLGGRAGDRLRGQALDQLRAAGMLRPEAIVEMYAPRSAP